MSLSNIFSQYSKVFKIAIIIDVAANVVSISGM